MEYGKTHYQRTQASASVESKYSDGKKRVELFFSSLEFILSKKSCQKLLILDDEKYRCPDLAEIFQVATS